MRIGYLIILSASSVKRMESKQRMLSLPHYLLYAYFHEYCILNILHISIYIYIMWIFASPIFP